eukprot:4004678-Prymnesium_polylepis.1
MYKLGVLDSQPPACAGRAARWAHGCARVLDARHGGLTVVLENVRKENVALITRTAEALGVATVHLIYTEDMQHSTRYFGALSDATKAEQLSKMPQSASDWVGVRMHASVAACLEVLQRDSLRLVATTPPSVEGAQDVYSTGGCAGDWALQRCAIAFGSEVHGLSDELVSGAAVHVTVPQRGMWSRS